MQKRANFLYGEVIILLKWLALLYNKILLSIGTAAPSQKKNYKSAYTFLVKFIIKQQLFYSGLSHNLIVRGHLSLAVLIFYFVTCKEVLFVILPLMWDSDIYLSNKPHFLPVYWHSNPKTYVIDVDVGRTCEKFCKSQARVIEKLLSYSPNMLSELLPSKLNKCAVYKCAFIN